MMKHRMLLLCVALAAFGCVGCASRPAEVRWTNPLAPLAQAMPADPDDQNYSLTRMEYGRAAVMLGSPGLADPVMMEAFEQLEADKENTAAALSSERYKFYKGESYERAMLCWYLGFIRYSRGEYNDARILFTRALNEDKKAVVKDDTPAEVGEDFSLAYFWLGRAYDKLGQPDNARIALKRSTIPTPRGKDGSREVEADRKEARKALKTRVDGETWTYETFAQVAPGIENLAPMCRTTLEQADSVSNSASGPIQASAASAEEFFSPGFQRQANLLLNIELGACPFKMLVGANNERVEIVRARVRPHTVKVFVDGQPAGEAYQVLDMWDQATTQDRILEKEVAQIGKSIAKEVLKQVVGNVANAWDVSGDGRYWTRLPGRVFVHASRVSPGLHTVTLRMYDINGNLLPRWTSTFPGLKVDTDGESVVLLNPHYDLDNTLPPDKAALAMKKGAMPLEE